MTILSNRTKCTIGNLCSRIFILLALLITCCGASAQSRLIKIFDHIGEQDTMSIIEQINKGEDLSLPDTALRNLTTALEKSNKIHFAGGTAMALAGLGNWYFGNDINKTISYTRLAQETYDKANLNDAKLKAKIHLLLATSYQEKGIRDSAGYYFYLLSDDIKHPDFNDPLFEINAYAKLTAFSVNMNYNIERLQATGTEYIARAKAAMYRMKDTTDAYLKLCFLEGMYYQGIKRYDQSLYYYQQILDKSSPRNINTPRKISIYLNIALIDLELNSPAKALPYIQKIMDISEQPENKQYLKFYLSVTNIIYARVLYEQKKYSQALAYFNNTLNKIKNGGDLLNPEIISGYEIAAKCSEELGKYTDALTYKNTYTQLHDSLMQKDRTDMISQLEMRFRIAEKDKELARQQLTRTEAESRIRKKNFWIAGNLLVIVCLIAIFLFWRRNNLHKQRLRQEKINSFQKQIEIEKLNAAISGEERERKRIASNLHDGIGGMLAVSKMNFEMSKQNFPENSRADFNDGIKLLEQAASELRKTAHNMMPQILLEEGLVEAVRYFCNGVAKSNAPVINFQIFGTPCKFAPEFELAIYRIVQELIHNILKHAEAKHALVQFNFYDDNFAVTVEDDGVGMETEGVKGMGMKSIKDRIKTNNGTINIQSSKNEGTSIYLEFESRTETMQIL